MPGQLTLSQVKRSKIDALAFDHKVEKSYFFNSVNPASDPDLYLSFLEKLSEDSRNRGSKVVVNTCGWVDGLGAEILLNFSKMLNSASTQFIKLESLSKPCDLDLSTQKYWHTVIKGDLRTHVTPAKPAASNPETPTSSKPAAQPSQNVDGKLARNKRLVASLLPPIKPDSQHRY